MTTPEIYVLTLKNLKPEDRSQLSQLSQYGIIIIKCMPENAYKCEVKDINLAKKCNLVITIQPYFMEPYITLSTQKLTEDKLVEFTVWLHDIYEKTSFIRKIKMLELTYKSYDASPIITIQLNYPEQKDLLSKINGFPEIYLIQEDLSHLLK